MCVSPKVTPSPGDATLGRGAGTGRNNPAVPPPALAPSPQGLIHP